MYWYLFIKTGGVLLCLLYVIKIYKSSIVTCRRLDSACASKAKACNMEIKLTLIKQVCFPSVYQSTKLYLSCMKAWMASSDVGVEW